MKQTAAPVGSAYLARPCRPLEQAIADVQLARAIEEVSATMPDLAHLLPGWRAMLKESRSCR